MKKIMNRAWEIYRTLEGDRLAKLAMALKQAWAEHWEELEARAVAKTFNMSVADAAILTRMLKKCDHHAPKPLTVADMIRSGEAKAETYINKKGKSISRVTFKNGDVRCWETEHLERSHYSCI